MWTLGLLAKCGSRRPNPPCAIVLAISLLLGGKSASAGDWPQILGPTRDGIAAGEQLVPWTGNSPQLVWQAEVGQGLAGVAVAGGRLVLFHRVGNELLAEARDVATGQARWTARFPTRYVSSISPDDGPRCVPLVHGKSVFLLGPQGELACVDLESGKQIWFRQICQEFSAPDGYFGTGSSPIVEGDKLLLNVGGRGAGIVAFSLADGATLWKSTGEAASYSSPVAVTLDGVRHVVFVTRLSVVSVDPATGKSRFQFPFGARGPTVNAASPLILGDHLFVSASYGIGAQWAKIGPKSADILWESDDIMSSQYTTCMAKDGLLYGIDGRQDVGRARLRSFDPATRKIHWTEENFGTGNLILAADKLLIMKTDGTLVLAEASSKAYRALATARLFDTTAQALPALADGRLFVRDTKTLKCLIVGKPGQTGSSN